MTNRPNSINTAISIGKSDCFHRSSSQRFVFSKLFACFVNSKYRLLHCLIGISLLRSFKDIPHSRIAFENRFKDLRFGRFIFSSRLRFKSRSIIYGSSLLLWNKYVQFRIFKQSNFRFTSTHGLSQSVSQCLIHCLINSTFVTEFNLALLGMYVNVDGSSVHSNVQHYKGETTLRNLRLVSVINSFRKHFITNHTTVNEQGLPLASTFQQSRLANVTINFNLFIFKINSQKLFGNILAIQSANGGS